MRAAHNRMTDEQGKQGEEAGHGSASRRDEGLEATWPVEWTVLDIIGCRFLDPHLNFCDPSELRDVVSLRG